MFVASNFLSLKWLYLFAINGLISRDKESKNGKIREHIQIFFTIMGKALLLGFVVVPDDHFLKLSFDDKIGDDGGKGF